MTHSVWDAYKRFITAAELVSKGVTSARVVIDHVAYDEMVRNPQTKKESAANVLYFKKLKRGLVLKSTNAQNIAMILGEDDMDKWGGRAVQLTLTEAYRPDMNGQGPVIRFAEAASVAPKEEGPSAIEEAVNAVQADPETGEIVEPEAPTEPKAETPHQTAQRILAQPSAHKARMAAAAAIDGVDAPLFN